MAKGSSSNNFNKDMRSEVLTAVKMPMLVFWVVTSCLLVGTQRFGGTYCLHFQGWRWRYNPENQHRLQQGLTPVQTSWSHNEHCRTAAYRCHVTAVSCRRLTNCLRHKTALSILLIFFGHSFCRLVVRRDGEKRWERGPNLLGFHAKDSNVTSKET
jgi:hypothetical protein